MNSESRSRSERWREAGKGDLGIRPRGGPAEVMDIGRVGLGGLPVAAGSAASAGAPIFVDPHLIGRLRVRVPPAAVVVAGAGLLRLGLQAARLLVALFDLLDHLLRPSELALALPLGPVAAQLLPLVRRPADAGILGGLVEAATEAPEASLEVASEWGRAQVMARSDKTIKSSDG